VFNLQKIFRGRVLQNIKVGEGGVSRRDFFLEVLAVVDVEVLPVLFLV
jgi:hypothetical protein